MANITKKAAYWTKIGDDNAKIHFETQADQVIVSPGVDGETNLQELLETIGSNETAIDGRLGDLESRATGVETRAANLEKREIAGNGPIGVVKSTTAGVIKHTISIDSAEEDTLGVVYITDGWNSSTGGPSSTAVSVTALGAYDEDVMGGHKIAKASADTLGHVKVGGNININADGVINANTATDTVAGVVKAGTNTTIVNGAVNVASGSTTTTGVLQLSNSLNSSTTTAITPSAVQFEISKLSKLFNPVGSVSIELTDEQRDNPGTISADITAALKAKHNNDSYVPAKGDAATVKVTGTEPSDAPYDKLGDLTGKTWIFIYGMDWEFGEIWTPEIQLQSDLTGAALLSGNNTFAGTNEFSNPLVVGAPEDNDHAATKLYVDEQITAGTPDASTTTKGITYISNGIRLYSL